MRISTNQIYYNSLNSMMTSASKANDAQAQLTSGKRITSAGDDPVAMSGVLALKQQAANVAHYQGNINQASSRLNAEEVGLRTVENLIGSAKALLLQGGNAARSVEDRQALADELRSIQASLLNAANSQDEFGNYLFGGYQTEQAPFVMQAEGTVLYQGDMGQRQARIGETLTVATSDTGKRVFQSIPNPLGDFTADYQYSSASDEAERVSLQAATIADHANYLPQDYTLVFDDSNADGVMEVDVLDAGGNSLTGPVDYEAGQTLTFNGVEVVLGEGNPQAGDQIVLSQQSEQDLFELINQSIGWLEGNPQVGAEQAQAMQVVNDLLTSLDSAFDHVNGVHGEVGTRMQLLERQTGVLEDGKIIREEARSRLEDVDYTQAILDYNKQTLSLQTSQQSYAKLNQLSLFNYL